jgi:hypothetical protein
MRRKLARAKKRWTVKFVFEHFEFGVLNTFRSGIDSDSIGSAP